MSKIERTPENYVMPLGKYKGMLLTDINKLTIIKNGITRNIGHDYLQWLCKPEQNWFRDVEFIKKVIGETAEEPKEEERPTKKKDTKKSQTVKITADEKLEFQ